MKLEFMVVLLPLFGALLAGSLNNVIGRVIPTVFVFISCIISWHFFVNVHTSYNLHLFDWIQVGKLNVHWGVHIDPLTTIMLIVVSTVATVVHVYSFGYMAHNQGVNRFFSYLSLFTFCMLVLVTSDNFLQLFFGWEGVGLCSYLLIGYWFRKNSANMAAIKAFVVNRVGDLFMLFGIFLIFWICDSLDYAVVFSTPLEKWMSSVTVAGIDLQVIDIVCIALFLGCMGKSAQLGLHVWLPDAMEGPTPVSALIHAATMVTAGVFLVARASFLFEMSAVARTMILAVGTATCVFAAVIALTQTDIKKIIAYSTCSQLGYMFMACGVSMYNAAIFHLMTHAFFKALLFLCAGNVIHSMHHEQDINKMGGLWSKTPITCLLMWVGSLALSGIFPFAGFYSKDLIVESVYSISKLSFLIGVFVAFLTALYSWRLLFKTFNSKTQVQIHHNIVESPPVMMLPLLILAFGAIFSGVYGHYFLHIGEMEFWHASIVAVHHGAELPLYVKFLTLFMSVLGILVASILYGRDNSKVSCACWMTDIVRNKFYIDEIYDYIIVKPVSVLSKIFWQMFDVAFIDRLGPNGIAHIVRSVASLNRKIHTGYVFDYAHVMCSGTVMILAWVFYRYMLF